MTEIKFSEHPDYEGNKAAWIKYRDLYEGKHETLISSQYLWMHEMEKRTNGGDTLRTIRQNRSRYLNLIEPVVSRWISFLFRNDINIPDDVKTLFGDAINDVDGNGTSLQAFCKDSIAVNYILYGKPIVLVDSYPVQAETKAEARNKGLRPYFEILHPLEVKDWQASKDPSRRGKYDSVRCEYEIIEDRASLTEAPVKNTYTKVFAVDGNKVTVTTYKAETVNNSTTWKQSGDVIEIAISEIPISRIEDESFIKDASEQQLQLFNYMSAESSILNASAHRQYFVTGLTSDKAKLGFGEYIVNFIPDGSVVTAIEPVSTDSLRAAITGTIDKLFKVAFNQIHSIASDSKEAPSAESQREFKEDFVALAISYIETLENHINECIRLWALFKGQADFKGRVQLDKNLTLQDVDQEIEILNALRDDLKKVPTAYREIVRKHVEDMNLPDMEKINQEIDSADFSQSPDSQDLNGGTKQRLLQQVTGGEQNAGARA